MNEITRFRVNTAAPYEIIIGTALLPQMGSFLTEIGRRGKVAVVTDDIVCGLYADSVCASLCERGYEAFIYAVPHGESSKSIEQLGLIWEFLAERHFTRKDTVLALGGGVAGDIAGFAAATYMRGIGYVQVPTTLLAAVDSSIGGKTAIDLRHGKNLAGAFLQPLLTVCDCDVLRKLPCGLFNDGMGEVIKHGILRDRTILEMAERENPRDELESLVEKNLRVKTAFVEADEYDMGARQMLNFGHTVGHALELLSGYKLSHGKAVALGIATETKLAAELGFCDGCTASRVVRAAEGLCAEPIEYSAHEIVECMHSDKKSDADSVNIVLPHAIEKCELHRISFADIESALGHVCMKNSL